MWAGFPRRFTAILTADVADYSQLMDGDEAGKPTRFMQTRRGSTSRRLGGITLDENQHQQRAMPSRSSALT
jgi:hypothetical protein